MGLRRLILATTIGVLATTPIDAVAAPRGDCHSAAGLNYERTVRRIVGRRFHAVHNPEGSARVVVEVKNLIDRDRKRLKRVLCEGARDAVTFKDVDYSRRQLLGFLRLVDRAMKGYDSGAGWGPDPEHNRIHVEMQRHDPEVEAAIRAGVPPDALKLSFDPNMVACLVGGDGCPPFEESLDPQLVGAAIATLLAAVAMGALTLRSRRSLPRRAT